MILQEAAIKNKPPASSADGSLSGSRQSSLVHPLLSSSPSEFQMVACCARANERKTLGHFMIPFGSSQMSCTPNSSLSGAVVTQLVCCRHSTSRDLRSCACVRDKQVVNGDSMFVLGSLANSGVFDEISGGQISVWRARPRRRRSLKRWE